MVIMYIINLLVGKKQEDEENDRANFVDVTEKTTLIFLNCNCNVFEENGSSVWYTDIG